MKKFLLTILLVMGTSVQADVHEWDTKTKVQFSIASVLTIADYLTTRNALRQGNFEEQNPILGKNPSDTALALALAAGLTSNYLILNNENEQQRDAMFIAITIVRGLVLHHNISIGAELKF